MRFGIKAFLCNVMIVLLAFGIFGYFIIHNQYRTSLNREVENVIEENQMLRAVLESELIKMLLRDQYEGISSIADLEKSGNSSLDRIQTSFLVLDEERRSLYQSGNAILEDHVLLSSLGQGEKNYVITRKEGQYQLTAASTLGIDEEMIYICNTKNITYVYENIEQQMRYYRIATGFGAALCSIFMFLTSLLMTRPVKKLNRTAGLIAEGNYSIRTRISSRDEIGELGEKFDVMAQAVENHVDELKEEARKRDEFVADFTHEMKTPLTAVIGYADMLRSKRMSEESQVMAADYIFREGMRLEKMSQKLFDLLLLDKYVVKTQAVPVPELVQAAAASVRPRYAVQNIEIHYEVEEALLNGDMELLKSVLINLLDNARKAMGQGGEVLIHGRREGDFVLLSVQDQGRGIAEEELDKITRAFYMVDKSRSRKSGGAGLGLALAAKIMALHRGRMTFKSRLGEGTVVTLVFPYTAEEE